MIVRYSPAKVNLFLRVLRKRADGYHDILSLMQRISLCDEMSFSLREEDGIVLKCTDRSLPEDRNNIVYRAAEAILSGEAEHRGVEITLNKKIPLAAGLGGGSSNAATTLLALNEMLTAGHSKEDLMKIGARLGADVPFFVFEGAALASGIGDHLEAVKNLPPMWFVLVNPCFEISTRYVYESLRLGLTKDPIKYRMPRFETVSHVAEELYNDLEKVSLQRYPVLSEIKERLMANGALGSLMSGSGPTVFGVFDNEEDSKRASGELEKEQIGLVFTVHSI